MYYVPFLIVLLYFCSVLCCVTNCCCLVFGYTVCFFYFHHYSAFTMFYNTCFLPWFFQFIYLFSSQHRAVDYAGFRRF